jgi:hypothetical protein
VKLIQKGVNFPPYVVLIDRRDMDEGRLIWTSATDAGNNCQGRYTWCNGGTNGAVNALTRLNFDQTTQATSDDCMAMMIRTVGTEMVMTVAGKPCIMPLPVICEVSLKCCIIWGKTIFIDQYKI